MPRSSKAPLPVTAPEAPARLFAGTSGWAYPTWKPGFYPADLPQKSFLTYYGSRLTSVEVNYTFRALPTPAMIAGWLAATPASFRFSFKAPQRITHFSRLRETGTAVAQLLSALEPVRAAGRLGLVLFQLPPNFAADPARLRAFLADPALRSSAAPPVAFEFRHPSWFGQEFSGETYAVLREANAALCVAEADQLATPEFHTAETHAAFRLRRSGGYTLAELNDFAARFAPLTATRDTYVYFKHEDEPTGALNAAAFLEASTLLGLPPATPGGNQER